MQPLDIENLTGFVNDNIVEFHKARHKSLEELKLKKLLEKNPYLLKAKYLESAPELIGGLMDAYLSSSEEKLFGDFLEGLAVYVAQQTTGGHKSSAQGIDLEFIHNGIHYIVSVKSGPNWGNSSQHARQTDDFNTAVGRIKQSSRSSNVEAVLGICYGKTRTTRTKSGYLKVVGQNFWYFISENENLYIDIVEPVGYKAKEYNEEYFQKKNEATNRLVRDFIAEFCSRSGAIDWKKLVRYNSGNFKLEKFSTYFPPPPKL